ncbi:DUF1129 domain-containing protein [Wolbachia endosymbiont of Chrysomya megacephala]|uniref:DUF1129 domain-containing protein n=1 Tax=Wolbachia endosymbiont of Chrysomya megacephala TaxID=1335053 RepID=UPI0011ED192E|nr:DUF1129 domain-containing protein [Wolbachia endosymbiont of Chrysomya megacephala]QEK89870.1 hypothetical protein CAI20_04160 [Wolbachia endosymbiont of Chrysomya megacephala]
MRDSVLKRYALAYIKENGSDNGVQEFLCFCAMQNIENWSDKIFEDTYKGFKRSNPTNDQHSTEYDRSNRQQTTGPQVTHVHINDNRGLDFWDYLLLSNLFGGRTTVINNPGFDTVSYQSREDKKKDSEDSRKLLALGIVAVVACVAFHALMCVWYNSSEKTARKSDKIDYLDSQLKMFKNIEFAVGAISLAALIGCAINPVLPVWGLVILGINSLVCLAGGVAFHMKHKKESENIKKAEEAVINYHKSEPGYDLGDSSNLEPPPPYSPQDPNTAPSAPSYDGTPGYAFGDPNATQQFGGCAAKP